MFLKYKPKSKRVKTPARVKSIILLVLLTVSTMISLPIFQPSNAAAVNQAVLMEPEDQIKSHIYYYALSRCMLNSNLSSTTALTGYRHITDADATAGKWWSAGTTDLLDPLHLDDATKTFVGPYMNGVISGIDGGVADCSNTELVSGALNLWGLDNPAVVLCNSGFERQDLPDSQSINDCISNGGNSSFESDTDNDTNAMSNLFRGYLNKIGADFVGESGNFVPDLKNALSYTFFRHTLEKSCIPGIDAKAPTTNGSASGDKGYNNVEWVDISSDPSDPKIVKGYYYGQMKKGQKVNLRVRTNLENEQMTCADIVSQMNNFADRYLEWAKTHPEQAAQLQADVDQNTSDPSKTTCAIDGVGWIVCPVVKFLAIIADSSYKFLQDSFLNVKPELFDTSSPTYDGWSIMRNFANVAFVIAFLIIIFSQLTGAGITNYGVKKLLPRIIIAAILVNISYFICQIGVDLSNILGKSLSDLFINLGGGPPPGTARVTGLWGGNSWGNIAGIVLAGAVAGAAIWASLSALIPILIVAVFALVMILFILVARQALIVLLVVISPLAFVAFLLPNTEKWYKNWQKMFVGLLMLYPIVGLVYGVSGFASRILAGTMEGILGQIAAASVVVLPLFIIPSLLKKSLDGIGNIGATLNNLGKGAGKRAGKRFTDSGLNQNHLAKQADRKARIGTGNYVGKLGKWNPNNLRSRLNRGVNKNRLFNAATEGYGATRELAAQSQDRKDTQEAMAMFGGDDKLAAAWAMDGGNHGTAYTGLTAGQQSQYDSMRSAGHHRRATSHLAAAQQLSENGSGTAAQVQSALNNARSSGANATIVNGATQAAISAYRKSGRGDATADLQGIPQDQGWEQVGSSSVHREGIAAGSAGAASYATHLAANTENTRKAVAGYDQMENRARGLAEPMIISAANTHAAPGLLAAEAAAATTATAARAAAAAVGATNADRVAAAAATDAHTAATAARTRGITTIQEAQTYYKP